MNRELSRLTDTVHTGDTVIVRDVTGNEVRGRVATITTSSLQLAVRDQLREWEAVNIVSIRASDSLTNGTVIGAVVGGTAGMFAGAAVALAADGLFDDDHEWCVYLGIAVGGIGGGFVGRTIDGHVHGRVLWRPAKNITVEPMLPTDGAGVRIAFQF